jgi:hypothetical protein
MNKYEKLGKMAYEHHRLLEAISAGTTRPRTAEELGRMMITQHKLEHKILKELKKVV